MEMDFILGAKTAFESSVTAIFNHKQIRAAQLLSDQIEVENTDTTSTVIDPIKEDSENTSATHHGVKVSENKADSSSSHQDASSSSVSSTFVGTMPILDSDPESMEALKEKLEAKKDRDAVLKDLNNDVKFVPNLEGSV